MSQPTIAQTTDWLTWTLMSLLNQQSFLNNLVTTVGNLVVMRSSDPVNINGLATWLFDDANTQANIEDNKIVRSYRRQTNACNCAWGWRDGAEGGTNPFVVVSNNLCLATPQPHWAPSKK